ncbi:MAG: hypothetical protein IKL82_01705 [Clostridia bacterium]|nr:hypothetical protein [Clostridia bacterium]
MNKTSNRLKKIIENDRLILSRESAEMIRYDLKEVLIEYFNLIGEVDLLIERGDNGYKITVIATAEAVKSFGIIR